MMTVILKFIPDSSMGQDFVNQADNFDLQVHHDDEDVLNTSLKFAFVNLESSSTPESEKSIGFRSSIHQEPNADAIDLDKSINMDQPIQNPADDHPVDKSDLTSALTANSEIQTKRKGTSEAPSVSHDLTSERLYSDAGVSDETQATNDRSEDIDSDLEELKNLKRRRESSPVPVQKAKKKMKSGYVKSVTQAQQDALFQEYNPDASIVRITKSSRQPKSFDGAKSFVIDINVRGDLFKLNQGDVSANTVKYHCIHRKSDCSCKGGAVLMVRKLDYIEKAFMEKSSRNKWFITKELVKEDVAVLSLMEHSCAKITFTAALEDRLTEKGIMVVKSQKEHNLNKRAVYPSEILSEALRRLKAETSEEERKKIREAEDKIDQRKIVDRITRELKKDTDIDQPINASNRETFDSYPIEFFSGDYIFDKPFAQSSKNESWLFVNYKALAQLNDTSDGIAIHDGTFPFGNRPKNDWRHFKQVWKLRLLKNNTNQLVAFACMSRQTTASYTAIFERLTYLNGEKNLKCRILVSDREKALMKSTEEAHFEATEKLYCAFHNIKNRLEQFRSAGLQQKPYSNSTDERKIFINTCFQLARTTPYLPIYVSRALLKYLIDRSNTNENRNLLGEADHLKLTLLMEKLDEDLANNGEHITWYNELIKANCWIDCTRQGSK